MNFESLKCLVYRPIVITGDSRYEITIFTTQSTTLRTPMLFLSSTKNLRRSKRSNFYLIKIWGFLICANFWFQRGRELECKVSGTSGIEIKRPLMRWYFRFTEYYGHIFTNLYWLFNSIFQVSFQRLFGFIYQRSRRWKLSQTCSSIRRSCLGHSHVHFTIWSSTSQFCLFQDRNSGLDGWLRNQIQPEHRCKNQILSVLAFNA